VCLFQRTAQVSNRNTTRRPERITINYNLHSRSTRPIPNHFPKFKDMGALNLAPTTIGEVRVTGVKARISDVCSFLLANLWVYTAQILLSKAIKPTLTVLATNVALSVDLFPRPAMITSIRAPNETILSKLLALGFTQQTQGNYKFFKGPGTDSAIRDLFRCTESSLLESQTTFYTQERC